MSRPTPERLASVDLIDWLLIGDTAPFERYVGQRFAARSVPVTA